MVLLVRIVLACLLLVSVPSHADTVLPLAPGNVALALNDHLRWWPDAPASAGLAEARANAAAFVPAPSGPGYGLQRERAWFRIDLLNAGESRELLLEVAFTKIDVLDVWLVHADGRVDAWQTGEARPRADRPLPLPRYLFPLSMAAGEPLTLFVRAETSAVMNLPFSIHDERSYLARESNLRAWLGIFYGLVLGVIAYNAFLFRTTRDPAFLNYSIASILALGYFASIDGYVALWLADWPLLAQRLLFLCGTFSVTFTLLFARGFLDLPSRAPRLDRVSLAVALGAALGTVLIPFVPALVALFFTIVFSLAMAVLMAVAGVLSLRQGFRPARWFVFAIVVHLVALSLVTVGALGIVPWLFAQADTVHRIGFVLNLVCFTLALGERIALVEQERRLAEERAAQAGLVLRARNDFLSRMSHELRTPMTGVLGMAELLDRTDLGSTQRRYLATLRYSGEMLLNLINDILDHARLEAGRLQLHNAAFDLLRLLDDCRLLFEQQPRGDGVTLRTDLAAGVPRVVFGDAQRVRQLLVNLLAVAYRRSTRGAIVLHVRPLDAASGWLRFEVEDGGPRLDAAAMARLFDPAAPAAEAGMGLAIARRLCEAMGGRMGVNAATVGTGDGIVLWFELPLHAAG